eukprot:Nk52_evm1s2055 gene=Nk52_evmTU1s2055
MIHQLRNIWRPLINNSNNQSGVSRRFTPSNRHSPLIHIRRLLSSHHYTAKGNHRRTSGKSDPKGLISSSSSTGKYSNRSREKEINAAYQHALDADVQRYKQRVRGMMLRKESTSAGEVSVGEGSSGRDMEAEIMDSLKDDRYTFQAKTQALPEDERLEFVAKRKLALGAKEYLCGRCWMTRRFCFCSLVEEMKLTDCVDVKVTVFFHFKEINRCSNTGKLIPLLMPNSNTFVYGLRGDLKALTEALLDNSEYDNAVLFPSPDACLVEEWLNEEGEKGENKCTGGGDEQGERDITGENDNNNNNNNKKKKKGRRPVHICVLDGTWNQAKSLNKSLPAHIRRVKIQPTGPSLFRIRKQSQLDRICTLEAFAAFLLDLGMYGGEQFDSDTYSKYADTLIDSLKYNVDANCMQAAKVRDANSGSFDMYGNGTEISEKAADQDAVIRPKQCGKCNVTAGLDNFQSKGFVGKKRMWLCRKCHGHFSFDASEASN